MLGYIYTHPMAVLVIGFLIVTMIAYYFIKYGLSSKVAKKDNPKNVEAGTEEKDIVSVDKKQIKKAKEKKVKVSKKPVVEKVFKTEEAVTDVVDEKNETDKKYDKEAEFSKASKNVSKFVQFKPTEQEIPHIEPIDDFGFVQDVHEDCELCENNVKHFDHSRRLSKSIRDNSFDDMFGSHLSDGYLNIDTDKHLSSESNLSKSLFGRTSQMLSNSGIKDADINNDVSEMEDRKRQEYAMSLLSNEDTENETVVYNGRIDAKTLMVSSVLANRKNRIKK